MADWTYPYPYPNPDVDSPSSQPMLLDEIRGAVEDRLRAALSEAAAQAEADRRAAADAKAKADAKADAAQSKLDKAKRSAADADKAKSAARAAYDAAVKEANAKKTAADAAKLQIAKGSLGFFESRGSEDAVKVLTDPNTTKYLSSIELGKEGDATSLENMKASLKYIRECNDLRAKEGLPPLKVSDVLMAQAQADVDWSDNDDSEGHAKQFNVGENLAWGYNDPFDGWYTDEKASYDKQKAEGVEHPQGTGHYTNIVNPNYDVTGFAISRTNTEYMGPDTVTHGQTFNNSAWRVASACMAPLPPAPSTPSTTTRRRSTPTTTA